MDEGSDSVGSGAGLAAPLRQPRPLEPTPGPTPAARIWEAVHSDPRYCAFHCKPQAQATTPSPPSLASPAGVEGEGTASPSPLAPTLPEHVLQPGQAPDPAPDPATGSPTPTLLEHVDALCSLGVVGAQRYAYVLARLVAAAAWKELLEEEPVRPNPGAARRVLQLLRAGASKAPQAVMQALLGPEALAPLRGAAVGEAGSGWRLVLEAQVFQDIDLLG